MKTPDEIKKGLDFCSRATCGEKDVECPYECGRSTCITYLTRDALALIQQLQAENAEQAERIRQLEARVKQLEAERDAAVKDISMGSRCTVCRKFFKNGGDCSGGVYCLPLRFEWRGVQKEE